MFPVPTGAGSISDSQEVSRAGVAVALCGGGYVAYGLVANEVRNSQWQAHYLGEEPGRPGAARLQRPDAGV